MELLSVLIVAFVGGWLIRSAKRYLFDYLPPGAIISAYADCRVDTVRRRGD